MSQPLPPTHLGRQLWAQWDFTASVFGNSCYDGCDGGDGVDGGVSGGDGSDCDAGDGDDGVDGGVGGYGSGCDGGDGDDEDGHDEVSDDNGDDDCYCYCFTNGKELERGNDLLRVTQLICGRV